MLTPLDIENKRFARKRVNGYSVAEVDEFLDELTIDYEKLYKEKERRIWGRPPNGETWETRDGTVMLMALMTAARALQRSLSPSR